MHAYRQFVQDEMDKRGWRQADLARASGLSRSLVSRILKDDRARLGQMPDESTMEALAKGFGVPLEIVRTAASRGLRGYVDDGSLLSHDLAHVSTDALLHEIHRRIRNAEAIADKFFEVSYPIAVEEPVKPPKKSVDDTAARALPGANANDLQDWARENIVHYGDVIDSYGQRAARSTGREAEGVRRRREQDEDGEGAS